MRQCLKYILFVSIGLWLLYTSFVVALEWISSDKRASGLSYSIRESKLNNSFVAEYEIQSIPDSTRQMLSELGLFSIIDTLDIWVEKKYGYKSEYLYFNKIEYGKENYLVFKNPRTVLETVDTTISMKIITHTYPDFGINMDSYILSNHNFFQEIVSVNLRNTTPDTLDLFVYLKFLADDSKDKICGKIKLKLKYINPDRTHIDKRHLWERITYAP